MMAENEKSVQRGRLFFFAITLRYPGLVADNFMKYPG
jgi:hypothetical protein